MKYDDKLVLALATDFAASLKDSLTPTEMAIVVCRNGDETDGGVCHSHDFCDANMDMLAAWEEMKLPEMDAGDKTHAALWGAAWGIAKKNEFWIGS